MATTTNEVRAQAAELMADEGAHDLAITFVTITDAEVDYNTASAAIKDWCHKWAEQYRTGSA
jgi:hypothetical protein